MTTEKGGRPIEVCAFCGTSERPRGLRKRDLQGRRVAACHACKGVPGLDVPDRYQEAVRLRSGAGPLPSGTGTDSVPVFLKVQDCRVGLDDLAGVDLFLTDPPYNIDFQYTDGLDDNRSDGEYLAIMDEVAWKSFRAANAGASFVLIHYHDALPDLMPLFRRAGWRLQKVRTWVYEDRRAVRHGRFPRSSRAMVWFTKGARSAAWCPPPSGWDLDWVSCEQVKGGSIGWQGYGCQVPAPILRNWIVALTKPGDLVADPFLGTASTAKEAVFLGRRAWGCDVNPEAVSRWEPLRAAAAGDRFLALQLPVAGPPSIGPVAGDLFQAVDGQEPGPATPVLVEAGSSPSTSVGKVSADLGQLRLPGFGPDIAKEEVTS